MTNFVTTFGILATQRKLTIEAYYSRLQAFWLTKIEQSSSAGHFSSIQSTFDRSNVKLNG